MRSLSGLAILGFIAVVLMSANGCSDKKVLGMGPEEAFQNPMAAALVKAAGRGDVAEIERLVEQGADVNAVGEKGVTPLLWAMYCLQKEAMRKLLELGADPNHKKDNGASAVWLAAGNPDAELLEILLEAGGDPNASVKGDNPLTVAIMQHHFNNVKTLVEYGADVNQTGSLSVDTAATRACALAQWDVVAYLLEHGYHHDLEDLAKCVEDRPVPKGTKFETGKARIKKMLEDRGVFFSDTPSRPLQ